MAISSEDVEAIKEELREELREEVKKDLREEFSPPGRSRRDVLKMGGAALGGAALGSVGGAAGAVGPGDEFLDVGGVTPNTYRIAGNWYGGPDGARSELVSELGAADTGARYGADDTGAWYYWTGSAWERLSTRHTFGPVSIALSGGVDGSTIETGLASEISDALSSGYTYISIFGHWSLDGDVSFRSADFDPYGVTFDARASYIEYDGSGFAVTNDCDGAFITEQRDGGSFTVEGGVWASTGTPAGWFKGTEIFRNRINPRRVLNFEGGDAGDANGSACIYLDVPDNDGQGDWVEANYFSGKYFNVDRCILSVADPGVSFQDNIVDDIHITSVSDAAFQLAGNWIDCKFENPTVIVDTEDACAFAVDGVMEGTEIDSLELEDAGRNLTNYYVYRPLPTAGDGPIFRGGDWTGSQPDFIDKSSEGGSPTWKVHFDYSDGQDMVRINARTGGNAQRQVLAHNGFELSENAADDVSGAWADTFRVLNGAFVDFHNLDLRNVNVDPPSAYTATNVTTSTSFDADTVTTAELADVVGTMIADLGMDTT